MPGSNVNYFLENFGDSKPGSEDMKRLCEVVKEEFDGSCLEWKKLYSEFRGDKEFEKISLEAMITKAETFKDWTYAYSATDGHPKERRLIYKQLKETGGIIDWLYFLSEDLEMEDEAYIKKQFLKSIKTVNFSKLIQPDYDFTKIPTYISQSDWLSLYNICYNQLELVKIVGKLVARAKGDFEDWWNLYDKSYLDPELRLLIIQKMKLFRKSEDISLWEKVYKELEGKSVKDNILMQAVRDMENEFNVDFYDEIHNGGYFSPTIDYLGNFIDE